MSKNKFVNLYIKYFTLLPTFVCLNTWSLLLDISLCALLISRPSYEAAVTCKDIARAPVTNWEPRGVTLAGYTYAVRHGVKFQLVTPYRVIHLQRDGLTVRGNVTVCADLKMYHCHQ